MVLQEFVTVQPCHPLGRSGEQTFPQILVVTPDKLIGGHQITPEPVLFQAKEPHGSQPVIVRSAFLTSDHARGSPLDSLKLLHILLELWSPKLGTVLRLQPHQGQALQDMSIGEMGVQEGWSFLKEGILWARKETIPI